MSSSPAIKALEAAIVLAKYNKDWNSLVETTLELEAKNEIGKTHVSSVLRTLVEERAPVSDLRRLIDQSDLADASERVAGREDDDSIFVTALKANADAEIVEVLLGTIKDGDFDVLNAAISGRANYSLATLKVLLTHHSEFVKLNQYIDIDDELVDKIMLLMRVYRTGLVEANEEVDRCFLHQFLHLEFRQGISIFNFNTILKEIIKKYPERCRQDDDKKEYLPVHLCVLKNTKSRRRRKQALQLLIEEFPESAFVAWSKRGWAPIHYLVKRRDFSPLFDKILDMVPLDRPCPRTGLVPALHAATRRGFQEDFHLECIYKLLRKDPTIVSSGTTGGGASLLNYPDYLELCRKDRELSKIHYEHHVKLTEMERKRKRQVEAVETERELIRARVETERDLLRARVESK